MAVIRKWLTPLEIVPSGQRYNAGTNRVQRSVDGGTTWTNDDAADPRHNDAFRQPPLSGTGHECDAAARIVHGFQDALNTLFQSVSAAQFATGLGSLFLALTGGIGILIEIAFAVGESLITLGVADIQAAFTVEEWEAIQCIISCHIQGNGQVTVAQRDAIMAEIAAERPLIVYNTLVNLVNLFGEVIMSNATTEYDDEGDCSECDACSWAYLWDFRFTGDIWTFDSEAGETPGFYAGGDGIHGYQKASTGHGCADLGTFYDAGRKSATFDIPSDCHITAMHINCDPTIGHGCSHVECWIGASRAAGLASGRMYIYGTTGDGDEDATGDITNETGVHCTFHFADVPGGDFYSVRLSGTGTPPNFTGGVFL